MPFGFQNHRLALSRLWCHRGAAIGYVLRHDRPGHDHGDASGSLLPRGRAVLNFTRAADECNVTQPSLTRAIKQLEAELGGDLFRRERPAAQLTELGQRMHPLLKQCYEAATGARAAGLLLQERRSRRAPDRADPFRRPVAADSASRPDQAAVQPAGIPLPARQRPRSRRVSQEGRSRTRHCRRDRRGVGPARHLAAVHRKLSARRQQAASAGGARQDRLRAIFAPSNCCREITASMRRG